MTSCRLQSNYSSTAARRASSVTSRCGLSWVTRRYKLVPILVQRPACGVCVRVVRLVYIWTVWSRRWRNSARGRWRLGSCGWLPICSWLQALTGNVDRSERLLRQSTESTVVTQFTHFVCSCQAVCLPSVLTAINFTWYQTLTLFSYLYQRPSVPAETMKFRNLLNTGVSSRSLEAYIRWAIRTKCSAFMDATLFAFIRSVLSLLLDTCDSYSL